MNTGWTITYTDAAGLNPVTKPLESFGAWDGGSVTGDGVKLSFKSHAASELSIVVPGADPATAPKIPFTSKVTLTDKDGVNQFVGRRIDWDGAVDGQSQKTSYTFQDAWWDLSQVTMKAVWWAGAYQPATLSGSTVTFATAMLGSNSSSKQAVLYDSAHNNIGIVNIVWTDTTHATISGSVSETVASASLLWQSTDLVLFQYRPTDPYQAGATVTQYYITTGAQIVEILNFAIANGVALQVGKIDPNIYVPWYPTSCCNCAEAIKICLRSHPDCFTEIDYTTTPPTFNVRQRAAGSSATGLQGPTMTPYTPVGLAQLSLPYAFTDASGNMHVATDIKPRPDLIPSRIGIFYRYLVNGSLVAFPNDIWPTNASDGLLAKDYSIDLQGPNMSQVTGQVLSTPFDPSNSTNGLKLWARKCHALQAALDNGSLVMCDSIGTAGTSELTVKDDNGNDIDYIGTYKWEFTGGAVMAFLGISVKWANIVSFFKYDVKDKNGVLQSSQGSHIQTFRVKLVNTASVLETFTQSLSTGEAIPANLAQNIFTALAPTQYNLSHRIKQEPFVSFIKPGKHGVNLTGGSDDWKTMNATVQTVECSLHAKACASDNGITGRVFAIVDVRCGPVEHLEAGQLVQLFNLFFNRDIGKIDPWLRITGTSGSGGTNLAISDTAQENAHSGVGNPVHTSLTAPTVDANGNKTVATLNSQTSGIKLFKWDGMTKGVNGVQLPKSGRPYVTVDLSDVDPTDEALIQDIKLRKVGTDGAGKPVYILSSSSSGFGSISQNWNRGLWVADPSAPYMMFDVVLFGSGTSAGMYMCLLDGNIYAPDSGIGWFQIGAATGSWQ